MSLRKPPPPDKRRSLNSSAGRTQLNPDAWIDFEPSWMPDTEAQTLLTTLLSEIDWSERSIKLFGKTVLQPRLVAWAGELPYRYSGQTLPPRPRPKFLTDLWHAVERRTGSRFNHVLLNRYRNGSDSMGWHADDEPELGDNPLLASLSFGVTRRFVVRSKAPCEPTRHWLLNHGSLLVMGGSTQRDYRHRVPRQQLHGERVNLTFRYLVRAPRATAS